MRKTIADLKEGDSFRLARNNGSFTILRIFEQEKDDEGYAMEERCAEIKTPDGRRVIWNVRTAISEGPVFPFQQFLF